MPCRPTQRTFLGFSFPSTVIVHFFLLGLLAGIKKRCFRALTRPGAGGSFDGWASTGGEGMQDRAVLSALTPHSPLSGGLPCRHWPLFEGTFDILC